MADCLHDNFGIETNINKLSIVEDGPTQAYMADIRIICIECGERFVFLGAALGVNMNGPAVSADGLELRIPIWPASDKG